MTTRVIARNRSTRGVGVVPFEPGEDTSGREQESAERMEHGLAHGTRANRLEQLVLERLEPRVEEVLLRREVVEDGLLGDVGLPCDLGDGDAFEAALGEEPARRLRDQLARLLLLAFS